MNGSLGWAGIVRLGLVQAALGAVVVLVTSTLNRVMVIEFALPAIVPGALVGAADRGGDRGGGGGVPQAPAHG